MCVVEASELRRSYRTRRRESGARPSRSTRCAGSPSASSTGSCCLPLGPNGAGKTTTIRDLADHAVIPAPRARPRSSGTKRGRGTPPGTRPAVGYVFVLRASTRTTTCATSAEACRRPPPRAAGPDRRAGRAGPPDRSQSRGVLARHAAGTTRPRAAGSDEPTIGIDPVGARELRSTIATRERAVPRPPHMFEADELCDRIAVIRDSSARGRGAGLELKRHVVPHRAGGGDLRAARRGRRGCAPDPRRALRQEQRASRRCCW